MQPIVVRAIDANRYEIIAGERRWRATQQAGLDRVPAIVREVSDEAAIAMALIENIQRENLNAIEESRALIRLQEEFSLTQQQVAEAVGKSRSAVANLMRLSALQAEVQTMLERGDIDLGHGKCLLALPAAQQGSAARSVVAKGLTVRQTEKLVAQLLSGKQAKTNVQPANGDIAQLERELSEKVGAPVALQHRANGGGKLVLSYASLDELDGILAHIR
jgi:ParB family chromosome partitioning protein